jgi:hypothetical protein
VKTATGTRQQATAMPDGKETIAEIVKILCISSAAGSQQDSYPKTVK